jgi:lipoyl(octanoyl) transferase
MAVDHALLAQVQLDNVPVLRLYTWQPACLSFGRNQSARGVYSEKAAADMGVDVVRRPTGGMAVLHARELTYAVVAPVGFMGGVRETYCTINRALVIALQKLGVPAELSGGTKRSAFGSVHPCFAEPAAGEVVVAGEKLVGSAQRCERRTILQHGSILLEGNQDDVARIASVPFDLRGKATTIKDVLGSVPEIADLAAEIRSGFAQVCGIPLAPKPLSASLLKRARELESIYRSTEWTWRL